MKSVYSLVQVVALLLALLCTLAHTSRAQEKHLRALERTMLMSYVLLDFATLDRMLADDYRGISHDGSVQSKKQIVEMVKTAAMRVDSIPVSEPKSRVFGNAALLTGIRKYYRAGRLLGTVRYSEIWELHKNSWQVSQSQLTAIQDYKK